MIPESRRPGFHGVIRPGAPKVYTISDFVREELHEQPLTLTQVAGFLLGLTATVLFVVLFLSGQA